MSRAVVLILLGGAAATGVGAWLDQPYGVVALGLAFAYAAFERGVAIGEKLVLSREDAARAVVALTDRVAKIEGVLQKYELADSYKRLGR